MLDILHKFKQVNYAKAVSRFLANHTPLAPIYYTVIFSANAGANRLVLAYHIALSIQMHTPPCF